MKFPYFFCVFSFNLLLFSTLNGQVTHTATIQLLLLNEQTGQPLETTIKWHEVKMNKDFFSVTDKNGRATVVIQGNAAYELSIPQSLEEYNLEVPNTPNYRKDITLKFTLEKEQPKPIVALSPPQQEATDIVNQNLIGLQLLNKPLGKKLDIIDMDSKQKVTSILRDTISFLLPEKGHFKLVMEGVVIQNDTINISAFSPKMMPFVLFFKAKDTARLYPILATTVLNLVQIDLKNTPVVGDSIAVIGKKSGLKYQGVTSENGAALFIVPKNDSYDINLKYFPKIATINVESSLKQDLATFSYTINYPSSKEVENREIEEKIRITERDSLYKLLGKKWELTEPQFVEKIGDNQDSIKQKLERDPHYFEKIKKVVCAVLYRYREKWTSKVIVTDVTGSMYPYMEELGLWHALEFMKEEKNTYIFFNDGDNKPDNEKIIGKTGGIYSTQNNATDTVVSLMYKAMNKGYGGDTPENNVETLLEAEKYAAPTTEIVMIADNYSAIKDISLLSKLTKPVHIILCGTSILQGIHPNYLWLAYKTHGSVHTIEEDIMNLSELVQGKIITIGGSSYKLLGNRFFEIK